MKHSKIKLKSYIDRVHMLFPCGLVKPNALAITVYAVLIPTFCQRVTKEAHMFKTMSLHIIYFAFNPQCFHTTFLQKSYETKVKYCLLILVSKLRKSCHGDLKTTVVAVINDQGLLKKKTDESLPSSPQFFFLKKLYRHRFPNL